VTSVLHTARLRAVADVIRQAGARSVLDLGCGDGDLLALLAGEPVIERLTGVDVSRAALERAEARLAPSGAAADIALHHGSIAALGALHRGYDAAVLVEVIEHVDPERLSPVEQAVFHRARPGLVVVTTPNADMNAALGVPARRMRHPDHRFEWGRLRFQRWAEGVAVRAGYAVCCADLGVRLSALGAESQMALFTVSSPAGPGR